MMMPNIIATVFYIGKLPLAPGTWGSLITLVLLWFILPISYVSHVSFIIVTFIIGLYSSTIVSKALNDHDPSEIIIDEVLGMAIALFMLPQNIILYLLAFFIFRFLDIMKPSFINDVQKLPDGWGIMFDDIVAGSFTWGIMQGISIII